MKQQLQFDYSISPETVYKWDRKAVSLAEQEKWDQAANILQQAADADPGQINRWLKIAVWRQRCGQISQAISVISRAMELGENSDVNLSQSKSTFSPPVKWTLTEQVELLSRLAHLYAQNSRWPECESACLKVLEHQSDNLDITELMSTACMQNEHLDAAEHLLLTLLRRVPLDPWYRMRYATLLQAQGKLGMAQQEFQRLLTMKLPQHFRSEVEKSIEYMDQIQFQQLMVLLEHNATLQTALANDAQDQLKILGFHLTEPALEMVQNVLWEHFDQSPIDTLNRTMDHPRLH